MNEFIDANPFMNKKYLRNLKEARIVKKTEKMETLKIRTPK